MPLQKQNININFAQGLDLKTDPFQVPAGKFLSLKNSVFDTAGRLTKRNGYQMLASLPDASSKYLTTFNNNLTAIGTQLEAFIEGTSEWVNKGNIQPVDLTVLPVVRSNTNQIQADVVVSSNNTMCAVYTDNVVTSTGIVPTYKYVIADAITGQNVIAPVTLTTTDLGTPRVFLLGNYFIILYTVKVVSTYHLRYIAVNIYTQSATASTDVASSYIPAASLAFDALTVGSNLYIAYNTTTGGQAVKVTYLTSSLSLVTAKTFASVKAQYFSMSADISVPQSPKIYIITYDSVAPNGDVIIVDQNLNTILAPTSWTTDSGIVNLASTADSGSGTIFYEVNNSYSYDSSIPTHYIKSVTCTQSGTIGTPAVTVRSVGLASKAILYNGISYFLAIYNSVFQPSYYLINQHGQVIAHFAYENGPASYYLYGLPNLLNNNNVLQTPYLFKDLIAAINTTQGAANAAGVYSQTGINLISLNMTPEYITTSEIGQIM